MAGLMQREQLGQSDRKLLGGICRGATRAGLGYNGWAFPIHPIQEVLSHWPEDRQLIPRARTLSALALYSRDAKMIRDQILAVLLAARDTRATTLCWAIYELSGDPEMIRHLRTEILSTLGLRRTPSYATLKEMRYLQAVISETLRLYPAVPFNMRVALHDTTLPNGGGQDGSLSVPVKKGTLVAYSPLYMQRRRELYPPACQDGIPLPDAELFEPDRWMRGWIPKSWTYIPFNGGPRICIGQQFALAEVGYTLVKLFQRYSRVERRMKEEDCGLLKANIVLTPAKGVNVAFFGGEE